MIPIRFETALQDGWVVLPEEGRVLVMRCPAELAGLLPIERCDAVHGFAPEHAAWARAGATMRDAAGDDYSAAIMTCPRSKDLAKLLLARALLALRPGGLMIVDGQKTDGIEPLLKALKKAFGPLDAVSKAHGKLIAFPRPVKLPEVVMGWAEITSDAPEGWVTAPGVFSANAIDPASALLVENLPPLKGRVCDLGAGWGVLSRAILQHDKVTHLDLVEAERDALEAAQHNVADPRAAFHWSDARSFGEPKSYDAVVTNPPFHAGRAADPALGQAFLNRARALLKPTGTLALVANRHLPYERTLGAGFMKVETAALTNGFKVIHATRPRHNA